MFDKDKWDESVAVAKEGEDIILEDDINFGIDTLLEPLPFTWGVEEIDNKIGLMGFNRLTIFAGDSGAGKTTFSLQQAIANANNGYKVAYMSLEMGREGIIKTTAKKSSGIKIQTKVNEIVEISPQQKKIYLEQINILTKNPNLSILGYKNSLSLTSFIKELDRISEEFDLIFIDNLGFIGRGDGIKEIELFPKITEALMTARLRHKVSIIALHHVNKGQENQKGPRGKAAIRGSAKTSDDADFVVMIHRQKAEEEGTFDTTQFLLMKDRDNGQNATVGLLYNKGVFTGDIF